MSPDLAGYILYHDQISVRIQIRTLLYCCGCSCLGCSCSAAQRSIDRSRSPYSANCTRSMINRALDYRIPAAVCSGGGDFRAASRRAAARAPSSWRLRLRDRGGRRRGGDTSEHTKVPLARQLAIIGVGGTPPCTHPSAPPRHTGCPHCGAAHPPPCATGRAWTRSPVTINKSIIQSVRGQEGTLNLD